MRKYPEEPGWSRFGYRNPDDPRLTVLKRSGLGCTLNFAHPWAWPLLLVMVGLPLLAVVGLMLAL